MKKRSATSYVALLTACIFLVSNTAWGMPTKLVTIREPAEMQRIDLDRLRVPANLGSIQEIYAADPDSPFVALIQDAHEIPEAQQNIHNLISFFQSKYGVDLVALEGAAEQLDSRIFQSFPDRDILKSVFQEYFDRGELTGGTAAAIFNEKMKADYIGIEDWDLYEKGLSLYLQALKTEPGFLETLDSQKTELERQKKNEYSQELFALDQLLQDFYEDHTNLLHVMKALAKVKAPAEGSELELLLKEGKGRETDDTALEREVRQIAKQIKQVLESKIGADPAAREQFQNFNAKYQEFQISRLKPEAFALVLREMTSKYKLPIKVTKQLAGLMQEQKRMRDIKGTHLFKDFEDYAQSVKDSLMTSDLERELDFESGRLDILDKLARLELSRNEWEILKVDPAAYIANDKDFRYQLAFYENAEARDHAFHKNLTGHLKKAAILVAGGFHTEGLIRQFRKDNISYVLLMPAMKSIPDETNYRAHMRGEVSWSDYFKVEDGRVNLYEAFVRGTRDKLLKKSREQHPGVPMRKQWRDQIIRDLAKEKRVAEAKGYVKFLDEVDRARQKSGANQWMLNVQTFVKGLKELEDTGRINKQEILKLLQPQKSGLREGAGVGTFSPATIATWAVNTSVLGRFTSIFSQSSGTPVGSRVFDDDDDDEELFGELGISRILSQLSTPIDVAAVIPGPAGVEGPRGAAGQQGLAGQPGPVGQAGVPGQAPVPGLGQPVVGQVPILGGDQQAVGQVAGLATRSEARTLKTLNSFRFGEKGTLPQKPKSLISRRDLLRLGLLGAGAYLTLPTIDLQAEDIGEDLTFLRVVKRATEKAQTEFKHQDIKPSKAFDYASPPEAEGMVYQEALRVVSHRPLLDNRGTGAMIYPRRGTTHKKLDVYYDRDGNGRYRSHKYSPDLVNYRDPAINPPLPKEIPAEVQHWVEAGIFTEILGAGFPQLLNFRGNGYGRMASGDTVYGASERGFLHQGSLGIQGVEFKEESFPELREIFIGQPAQGKVKIYQIYESVNSVMVRTVEIDMRQKETIMNVSGRIIPRKGKQIEASDNVGMGFSSMYWRGPAEGFSNSNAANDSDTVIINLEDGTKRRVNIRKPPADGQPARYTSVRDRAKKRVTGWSLEKRNQNKDEYIPGVRYADRASFFVSDMKWTLQIKKGKEWQDSVLPTETGLIVLPHKGEYADNVVMRTVLKPRRPIVSGQQVEFSYTLTTKRAQPEKFKPAARVKSATFKRLEKQYETASLTGNVNNVLEVVKIFIDVKDDQMARTFVKYFTYANPKVNGAIRGVHRDVKPRTFDDLLNDLKGKVGKEAWIGGFKKGYTELSRSEARRMEDVVTSETVTAATAVTSQADTTRAPSTRQVWKGTSQRTGSGYDVVVDLTDFEDAFRERQFLQSQIGRVFTDLQAQGLEAGSRVRLGVTERADGTRTYTFRANIPGKGVRRFRVQAKFEGDGMSVVSPARAESDYSNLLDTALVPIGGITGVLRAEGFIFDADAMRAQLTHRVEGDEVLFTLKATNRAQGTVTIEVAVKIGTADFVVKSVEGLPFERRGTAEYQNRNDTESKQYSVALPRGKAIFDPDDDDEPLPENLVGLQTAVSDVTSALPAVTPEIEAVLQPQEVFTDDITAERQLGRLAETVTTTVQAERVEGIGAAIDSTSITDADLAGLPAPAEDFAFDEDATPEEIIATLFTEAEIGEGIDLDPNAIDADTAFISTHLRAISRSIASLRRNDPSTWSALNSIRQSDGEQTTVKLSRIQRRFALMGGKAAKRLITNKSLGRTLDDLAVVMGTSIMSQSIVQDNGRTRKANRYFQETLRTIRRVLQAGSVEERLAATTTLAASPEGAADLTQQDTVAVGVGEVSVQDTIAERQAQLDEITSRVNALLDAVDEFPKSIRQSVTVNGMATDLQNFLENPERMLADNRQVVMNALTGLANFLPNQRGEIQVVIDAINQLPVIPADADLDSLYTGADVGAQGAFDLEALMDQRVAEQAAVDAAADVKLAEDEEQARQDLRAQTVRDSAVTLPPIEMPNAVITTGLIDGMIQTAITFSVNDTELEIANIPHVDAEGTPLTNWNVAARIHIRLNTSLGGGTPAVSLAGLQREVTGIIASELEVMRQPAADRARIDQVFQDEVIDGAVADIEAERARREQFEQEIQDILNQVDEVELPDEAARPLDPAVEPLEPAIDDTDVIDEAEEPTVLETPPDISSEEGFDQFIDEVILPELAERNAETLSPVEQTPEAEVEPVLAELVPEDVDAAMEAMGAADLGSVAESLGELDVVELAQLIGTTAELMGSLDAAVPLAQLVDEDVDAALAVMAASDLGSAQEFLAGLDPVQTADQAGTPAEIMARSARKVELAGLIEGQDPEDSMSLLMNQLIAEESVSGEESAPVPVVSDLVPVGAGVESDLAARSEARQVTTESIDVSILTSTAVSTALALSPDPVDVNFGFTAENLSTALETGVMTVTQFEIAIEQMITDSRDDALLVPYMQEAVAATRSQVRLAVQEILTNAPEGGINMVLDLQDGIEAEVALASVNGLGYLLEDFAGDINLFLLGARGGVARDVTNAIRAIGRMMPINDRDLARLTDRYNINTLAAVVRFNAQADVGGAELLIPVGLDVDLEEWLNLSEEARELSTLMHTAHAVAVSNAKSSDEISEIERKLLEASTLFQKYGAVLGTSPFSPNGKGVIVNPGAIEGMLKAFAMDAQARDTASRAA